MSELIRGTCSFCGGKDRPVGMSERFEDGKSVFVRVCLACATWLHQKLSGSADTERPEELPDSEELPTNPQAIDAETMALLYPDHPEDAPCLDCGSVWAEHETFPGDDGCYFTLNDEENRLARARREVKLLLDRRMSADDVVLVVRQVAVLLEASS